MAAALVSRVAEHEEGRREQLGTATLNSISHMESAILVERFQSGESDAFDEIVDRCQRHVYNLAYHFTHNCEDAYDISQEVFIKVFRSLDKLKNSSVFDAWLRRVTVNACMDYLRQRPHEQILDDFSYLDRQYIGGFSSGLPDRPVENGELRHVISRAVDRLPKRQQRVFILRHYEGLSLKEIAKTLNCSLGTVKAHLFRATRRLRKMLLPYVS
jgi:RNA polymerase sigma-70 factor (ECF subfamily)